MEPPGRQRIHRGAPVLANWSLGDWRQSHGGGMMGRERLRAAQIERLSRRLAIQQTCDASASGQA